MDITIIGKILAALSGVALITAVTWSIYRYHPVAFRNLFFGALAIPLLAISTGSKVDISMKRDGDLLIKLAKLEQQIVQLEASKEPTRYSLNGAQFANVDKGEIINLSTGTNTSDVKIRLSEAIRKALKEVTVDFGDIDNQFKVFEINQFELLKDLSVVREICIENDANYASNAKDVISFCVPNDSKSLAKSMILAFQKMESVFRKKGKYLNFCFSSIPKKKCGIVFFPQRNIADASERDEVNFDNFMIMGIPMTTDNLK